MRFSALVLCLFATLAANAGEFAVFASGSRLHVDRHEVAGDKVRLYVGGGTAELDVAQISSFEADGVEPTPPVPANSAPAAPATASRPASTPQELADAAADKYGLPRRLVRSVMAAESGFRTDAVSPKGAIGLMQLMPATAQAFGVDIHDPAQNVDAGVRYLRDLLAAYDYGLWHALAAYNAGSGAVEKYGGVPPYRETIQYINRIDRAWRGPEPQP